MYFTCWILWDETLRKEDRWQESRRRSLVQLLYFWRPCCWSTNHWITEHQTTVLVQPYMLLCLYFTWSGRVAASTYHTLTSEDHKSKNQNAQSMKKTKFKNMWPTCADDEEDISSLRTKEQRTGSLNWIGFYSGEMIKGLRNTKFNNCTQVTMLSSEPVIHRIKTHHTTHNSLNTWKIMKKSSLCSLCLQWYISLFSICWISSVDNFVNLCDTNNDISSSMTCKDIFIQLNSWHSKISSFIKIQVIVSSLRQVAEWFFLSEF